MEATKKAIMFSLKEEEASLALLVCQFNLRLKAKRNATSKASTLEDLKHLHLSHCTEGGNSLEIRYVKRGLHTKRERDTTYNEY